MELFMARLLMHNLDSSVLVLEKIFLVNTDSHVYSNRKKLNFVLA